MEGEHVRVRRLIESRMHAVQQGMGDFVSDDVVGKACKDQGARRVVRVLPGDREVAE
jgi:hypothetical protein